MRFDPDCFRDVLLAAEDLANGEDSPWLFPDSWPGNLLPYTVDEAKHHVNYCITAGYLIKGADYIDKSYEIVDVTAEGHAVIDVIRNPPIYERARNDWLSKVKSGIVEATIQGFVSLAVEIWKTAHLG